MQELVSIWSIVVLAIGIMASLIAAYFVWKNVDFFISEKDRFASSPFGLLKKKISLTITAAGLVIIITIIASLWFIKEDAFHMLTPVTQQTDGKK